MMLTEERYRAIIHLLESRGAVSVPELAESLGFSESTIRRDLSALDAKQRLKKVHGGATSLHSSHQKEEYPAFCASDATQEEHLRIARHAASLIQAYDLVYLDAGKTIRSMADFITAKNITIVTNGLQTASELAHKGFTVLLTGGLIKPTTEALVGGEALSALQRYNFSISFLGANGIHLETGCTTPDADEARMKTNVLARSRRRYLLADSSKFGQSYAVTFASLCDATMITGAAVDAEYRQLAAIIEVKDR